jgi:hypothetical protein
MDASTLVHPVGPLPPRVYWTRRLVLLGVLVVLVVAIAVSCSAGSGSSHRAAANPTPSTSPASTTTPSACTREQIAVVAETDATRYPAGVQPRLRVAIRNRAAVACILTDSPSTRTWTIVSGADQVWTTAGCSASHRATRTTLAPGDAVRHSTLWNRHRSGKGCTASTTEAGPGTYQLTVTVDGVVSDPAIFHLAG